MSARILSGLPSSVRSPCASRSTEETRAAASFPDKVYPLRPCVVLFHPFFSPASPAKPWIFDLCTFRDFFQKPPRTCTRVSSAQVNDCSAVGWMWNLRCPGRPSDVVSGRSRRTSSTGRNGGLGTCRLPPRNSTRLPIYLASNSASRGCARRQILTLSQQ